MASTTKADQLTGDDKIAQMDEEMHHATHPAAEVWAYGAAGWLTVLALPHLLFPRILVLMSAPAEGAAPDHEKHPLSLTKLEGFLAMHFGILLIALALCLVLAIPSASPVDPRPQSEPIQHPLLTPLSLALGVIAFSAWNSSIHGLGAFPMIVSVGCGAISMWGFWVMFFASSLGHHSKKTGADKRTSAFLFGNKQSACEQKKEYNKTKAE
ncbi:hypothetical protein EXIGLDRAFT_727228 [Exidia glandulosa HHB12029]|uniref:Uncharacterized protein n=1 Tax=Exidia glandulosa HHB12029 TaxID=1314781 RepID=A0A165DFE5_EXIGL|nr:hypothetical protein EXIGLDRAFT_727228 [Exidia glandulosa HHB12029]